MSEEIMQDKNVERVVKQIFSFNESIYGFGDPEINVVVGEYGKKRINAKIKTNIFFYDSLSSEYFDAFRHSITRMRMTWHTDECIFIDLIVKVDD